MRPHFGQSPEPLILLHGGAGLQDSDGSRLKAATDSLRRVAAEGMAELRRGAAPIDVAVTCLQGMELDEQFNAGRGAALQADGLARLTAAVMDGASGRFSGVMGVRYVLHPSLLARALQTAGARVLAEPGAELLARRLGLPIDDPLTADRIQRWVDARGRASGYDEAPGADGGGRDGCDTVGCVVRAADGRLAVGTSTGGRGNEFPGRISDSGTVAGTYATRHAAISATGTGEEIVDDALAARIETRRRDGMTLEAACRRAFDEAVASSRAYGWIALDASGFWSAAHTTPAMSWVAIDASRELAAADQRSPR